MTQTLQGALQAAIRSALNCANDFNGDLHAMCDMYGITAGPISGRLIPAANRFDASITDASSALNYFLQNPQNACGTLALDFTRTSTLDPRITFSRGSQATLFDSTGALVYAKHNLLLQSQTFDNASWTKTRSSVTQDTAVAPDGTTTADSLVEDGTAANTHDLRQSVTNTGTNTWALSVYLKAVNRSWAAIELQNATATSNRARAWFDLQNGVVGTGNTAGSGVTYVSHSIQNVGNDWYRCILVGTADSAVTSVQAWLEGTTADNLQNYNGVNGQTSVYIWGAQLNLTAMEGGVTSSLSTYYPTVASAYYAPRFDYNPSTLAAQGLLIEEQRTNLLLQSQAFNTTWTASGSSPAVVTADTTTSLDGTVNADTISGTGVNSDRVQQTVTVAASTTYVLSFFVKNSTAVQSLFHISKTNSGTTNSETYINWSGANITSFTNTGTTVGVAVSYPNNWWRVYFAFTTNASDAGTATVRFYPNGAGADATFKNVFLWGAQLEAGAFPTSYIPTTTTALTRNADVASMTGTNFSSWYNASFGTVVCDAQRSALISSSGFANLWAISDNSSNERFLAYNTGSGQTMDSTITDGGVSQGTLVATGAITANSSIKTAFAYAVNDFAWVRAAGTVQTDTSGTLPAVDRLYIGANAIGGGQWTGTISRLAYYPVRLPNSTLQALTA